MKRIEEEIGQKQFHSEDGKLLVNLLNVAAHIRVYMSRFFRPFGLSPYQYNVLRILRGQYPKPISLLAVQERMIERSSNTSRLVDKLHQKGWLRRTECPKDRRQVDLVITEKGLALLTEIDGEIGEMKTLFSALTGEEQRQMNDFLDRIRN